jgi:lysylphosphatidylglycerol synthetase-like protein (DUF2156 family)
MRGLLVPSYNKHMANLWLKIRVWSKIIFFVVVAAYAGLFIYKNVDKPVTIWLWFGKDNQVETTALRLIFVIFIAGVIGTLFVRTIVRTIRQVREIRSRSKSEQMQRDLAELQQKAAKLQVKPSSAAPEEKPIEQVTTNSERKEDHRPPPP